MWRRYRFIQLSLCIIITLATCICYRFVLLSLQENWQHYRFFKLSLMEYWNSYRFYQLQLWEYQSRYRFLKLCYENRPKTITYNAVTVFCNVADLCLHLSTAQTLLTGLPGKNWWQNSETRETTPLVSQNVFSKPLDYRDLLRIDNNCVLCTFYAASSEVAYSFSYEAVLWL